jgi:hypothetical protein
LTAVSKGDKVSLTGDAPMKENFFTDLLVGATFSFVFLFAIAYIAGN